MTSRNPSQHPEMTTRLRHKSHVSECENGNGEPCSSWPTSNPEGGTKDDRESSGFDNMSTEDDSERNSTTAQEGKSLLGYFMKELTKHYRLEADASEFLERRDRVYTSVYTPKNLEKFLAFGFLQCLDSILYMVTFLPLRILVALMRLLTYPCTLIFIGKRPILDASQVCDLLKGLILVVSCYITSQVDMSMIYHIVRGQSIMKFYVFFNMLDVMDKLVSQFGQDILDSLYWTAVEPRGRKREHFGTFFHLVFATVYVVAHTMMILMQAIILNVAFNSHNKNLLTVMMSNNFVEIKVNVFKRVDKTNLCQITYSDVRERFHYLVLLFFVFIRNMKELQWNWDMAPPLLQDAAIVFLVEVFVDWIKHAFITKLSELSASHYGEFSLGLAQDIASSQKKHAFTNFSDQVCRRMGFTPMPLICLLYMVSYSSFTVEGPLAWFLVFLLYICLVSTKVLNSIILLGWAQRLITERDKTAQSTGTVVNSQTHPKKEVGKKPAPQKPDPPVVSPVTRLSESDTALFSHPVATDPSLGQNNVTWSSSFTAPNLDPSSGLSSVPWEQKGPNSSNGKSSSSFLLQSSSSLSVNDQPELGHNQSVQGSGVTNGFHKDTDYMPEPLVAPLAHPVIANTQNSFKFSTPSVATTTATLSSSIPLSTGLTAPNQMPEFCPAAGHDPLSASHPATNQTFSVSPPMTLDHQSHGSSFSASTNFPTQLDRVHAAPSPAKISDVDSYEESPSVRSPKRKHSASSINSADSFFMENPDPVTTPAVISDNFPIDGDNQNLMITSTTPDSEVTNAGEKPADSLKSASVDPAMDVLSYSVSGIGTRDDTDCLVLSQSDGAKVQEEPESDFISKNETVPGDDFSMGEPYHGSKV